jgi:hypothetical protein
MKNRQQELTNLLKEGSDIDNLYFEFRYYRSKVRRNRQKTQPQFAENETGADFAIALRSDLYSVSLAQRHVLAQAKLIENNKIRINQEQLTRLEEHEGSENSLYMFWGESEPPVVATVANVKAMIRASENRTAFEWDQMKPFTRLLADYVVDGFLGMWHGVDFYSLGIDEDEAPKGSPPVLYNLLHRSTPPPNVVYFEVGNSRAKDRPSGFYPVGIELPLGTPIL